jgi:hypothetical protein
MPEPPIQSSRSSQIPNRRGVRKPPRITSVARSGIAISTHMIAERPISHHTGRSPKIA